MSSRQMHRFLENLGSGGQGSAEGRRLSSFDAMERFRQRIEEYSQQVQEGREVQEQQQQARKSRIDEIWQQAQKEVNNQAEGE